jgi:beta-galactosidase
LPQNDIMDIKRNRHHPAASRWLPLVLLLVAPACSGPAGRPSPLEGAEKTPRSEILFDSDWRFHREDAPGAEGIAYDDSDWRQLDLPHDWSIEDIPGSGSPLDSNAAGGIDMGYFVGGTGWYRKTFYVPSSLEGKIFHMQFDGIYMIADVWLNGRHLGSHPYGYTSFWYDITPAIRPGRENILAVRVSNEGRNSRWYSGSGIYRHARLSIMNPVHVAHWGTSIIVPGVSETSAGLRVETDLVNQGEDPVEIILRTRILDGEGSESIRAESVHTLDGSGSQKAVQELLLEEPIPWSPDNPYLYTAVTELLNAEDEPGDEPLDVTETPFGVRTISFDAASGFLLNRSPTLLRGGCVHHDNGPLGSAAFDRAEERRVELLRASGFNAIRCAHNPPSPAFLDACDRLGMLVIDEAFDMWRKPKNPQDYHLYFDSCWRKDIESIVLRDRNHPCVIMWSTGNEIPERGNQEGIETSRMLSEYIRSLDPTRPVTSAVNGVGEKMDPYFATLDVCGYNYAREKYRSDRKRVPGRIIYGSESMPLEAFDYWIAVLDNPPVLGDFVWTGFDYLGEASIGWLGYPHDKSFYPWHVAFCGDIDICGIKRPQSHYRDALWQNGPNVSIFVKPPLPSFPLNPDKIYWSKWEWQDVVGDWTWPGHEGQEFEIEVYSSSEQVELLINDRSLGKKPCGRQNRYITRWKIPYEPGTLRAIAYDRRQETSAAELKTAGQVTGIRLTADRDRIRADGQDLSFVTVELVDERGTRNPKACDLVNFELEGPGSIQAVGSTNPVNTESYRQPFRKAWQGRCLVILRSGQEGGEITLKAHAGGIEPARIIIRTFEDPE